jgi:hypothetical protein
MKKTALLVLSAMILAPAAFSAEPLLIQPLQTTVLSSSPSTYDATTTQVEAKSPIGGGVYEATYTPSTSYNYGENMIPQNAAAKGEPVPVQQEPRVRIQTKQRSQGNSYWNPGGKGTKSFF